MNILITGLNGTLAPHFARHLTTLGHTIIGWDREQVNPDDRNACWDWLNTLQPDAVLHLAFGSEEWAGQIAVWCRESHRPMLYISTAMVFDSEPDGPHYPQDMISGKDDYGCYKARCEKQVVDNYPNALIVRIGWQIDFQGGGNNMFHHLQQQHDANGCIEASQLWIPAASFMPDTAAVAWQLLESGAHGIHHLDSNAQSAINFYEMVTLISQRCQKNWTIKATQNYQHDQRLIDARVTVPSLQERLE